MFAILGVVLAIVAVQVYRTVGDLFDANGWVNHTYQVKEQIVATVAALRDAEAAQRAYLIGGNATRLTESYAALPRLAQHMTELQRLVTDNPAQIENARNFETILAQRKDLMVQSLATYQKMGLQDYRSNPQLAVALEQDTQVDALAGRMIALEDTLLARRQQSSEAPVR